MTKRKAVSETGLSVIILALILVVSFSISYGYWVTYQEGQKKQLSLYSDICRYKGFDAAESELFSATIYANHTQYIRCVKGLVVRYFPANTTIPEDSKR